MFNFSADKINYELNNKSFVLNFITLLVLYGFTFYFIYKFERSKRKYFIYKYEYKNYVYKLTELLNSSNKIQYIKFNSENILFLNNQFKFNFTNFIGYKENYNNNERNNNNEKNYNVETAVNLIKPTPFKSIFKPNEMLNMEMKIKF